MPLRILFKLLFLEEYHTKIYGSHFTIELPITHPKGYHKLDMAKVPKDLILDSKIRI